MTGKEKTLSLALLFVLSLGLAAYFAVCLGSGRATILDHSLRISPLEAAVLAVAAFLLLAALWMVIGRAEARTTGAAPARVLAGGLPAFLPFAFLLLSPVLLAHYTTREDLRTRLAILGALVFVAFFVLTRDRLRRSSRRPADAPSIDAAGPIRDPGPAGRRSSSSSSLPSSSITWSPGLLVRQGIEFSGDEPNYLLTADSLYYDRDIDLANNYADEDWFHFYSREEHPRLKLGIYGRYGKGGRDHIYPINLPGVSVLTLPSTGSAASSAGNSPHLHPEGKPVRMGGPPRRPAYPFRRRAMEKGRPCFARPLGALRVLGAGLLSTPSTSTPRSRSPS